MRLHPATLGALAGRFGGEARGVGGQEVGRFVPVEQAEAGDLAPLLARRFARAALAAHGRGAHLLIDASLLELPMLGALGAWVHPHAGWAMAGVLDEMADADGPSVILGARVRIAPSSIIGGQGFGWVSGPEGKVRQMPHLGGVVLEDDVYVGPFCTIDAGVLGPTRIRRGVKIDAHVHVGHNCDVGESTMIAAQAGLAGSVTLGKGVLVGGQAGIADHVRVGDGARIAAKAGVIGDVPAGAVVAGYPAVPRVQWLRAAARRPR